MESTNLSWPNSRVIESTNFTWPYVGNDGTQPRPIYLSPSPGFFQYHSAALFLILTIASLTVAYLSACPYRKQLFKAQEHQAGGINTVPYVPHWIPYLGVSFPVERRTPCTHPCLS